MSRPKVLISACIEHSSVRYDGTMISDEVVRALKKYVDFMPVCPEVAIGMPSPRDTIRLVQREGEELKLLSSVEGIDYTEKMKNFTSKYVSKIKDVDGFILKAKSPTCGTDKVKVYRGTGKAHTREPVPNGMFANDIVEKYSDYPIETERRLSNFSIREHFFIQIFTTALFRDIKKNGELVDFHTRCKYLFMTYNQTGLRRLGNIVANHDRLPLQIVLEKYEAELRILFKNPPSRNKRINVLTHIYGYFKNQLSDNDKTYYFQVQDDYLKGHIAYSGVLGILYSYAIRFGEEYLLKQYLFEPFPKQLIQELDSGKKI